jgi:competence protein ComEC
MGPAWVVLGEPHAGLADGIPCRAGMHWWWDEVRFTVLHPPPGRSGNAASCVVLIESGGRRLLLPGDLEDLDLDDLAMALGSPSKLDVLVAPHHGAKKGATTVWMSAVQPHWVLYSAGFGNAYGHPAAQVVQGYAAMGSRQLATACNGALLVEVRQGHVTVITTRGRAQASCSLPVPASANPAAPKPKG